MVQTIPNMDAVRHRAAMRGDDNRMTDTSQGKTILDSEPLDAEQVKMVQRILQMRGLYDGRIDGIPGRLTQQGAAAWRRQTGITRGTEAHQFEGVNYGLARSLIEAAPPQARAPIVAALHRQAARPVPRQRPERPAPTFDGPIPRLRETGEPALERAQQQTAELARRLAGRNFPPLPALRAEGVQAAATRQPIDPHDFNAAIAPSERAMPMPAPSPRRALIGENMARSMVDPYLARTGQRGMPGPGGRSVPANFTPPRGMPAPSGRAAPVEMTPPRGMSGPGGRAAPVQMTPPRGAPVDRGRQEMPPAVSPSAILEAGAEQERQVGEYYDRLRRELAATAPGPIPSVPLDPDFGPASPVSPVSTTPFYPAEEGIRPELLEPVPDYSPPVPVAPMGQASIPREIPPAPPAGGTYGAGDFPPGRSAFAGQQGMEPTPDPSMVQAIWGGTDAMRVNEPGVRDRFDDAHQPRPLSSMGAGPFGTLPPLDEPFADLAPGGLGIDEPLASPTIPPIGDRHPDMIGRPSDTGASVPRSLVHDAITIPPGPTIDAANPLRFDPAGGGTFPSIPPVPRLRPELPELPNTGPVDFANMAPAGFGLDLEAELDTSGYSPDWQPALNSPWQEPVAAPTLPSLTTPASTEPAWGDPRPQGTVPATGPGAPPVVAPPAEQIIAEHQARAAAMPQVPQMRPAFVPPGAGAGGIGQQVWDRISSSVDRLFGGGGGGNPFGSLNPPVGYSTLGGGGGQMTSMMGPGPYNDAAGRQQFAQRQANNMQNANYDPVSGGSRYDYAVDPDSGTGSYVNSRGRTINYTI